MEILSAKGTKTVQYREDGLRESVIECVIEVSRGFLKCPAEKTLEDVAELMGMPSGYFNAPDGFARESSLWTINADGTELELRFVDVEQKPPIVEDDPKPIIGE